MDTLYTCVKCGHTHIRRAGAIYTANVPTHCGLVMRASGLPQEPQPYQEERARIVRHLEQTNEELLGLHRYGAMTYQEYTNIADLLIEAQERLKKHSQADTRREERTQ